jgi:acyl-CoA thioesterase I
MHHRRPAILGFALLASLVTAAGARAEETIAVLGDSISAGFGVTPEEAYPARLQERLRREGYDYRVVNAGVSGDTTAGGLRRVDWVLRARPSIAIVALGGNDGLRGLSVVAMRANLEQIVERLQAAGAQVLLTGMRVPPNYGDAYAREFAAAFPAVAVKTGAALMPFLLDGVAADTRLNQPDGIHPTARGQAIIAERLWPYLKPLLRK